MEVSSASKFRPKIDLASSVKWNSVWHQNEDPKLMLVRASNRGQFELEMRIQNWFRFVLQMEVNSTSKWKFKIDLNSSFKLRSVRHRNKDPYSISVRASNRGQLDIFHIKWTAFVDVLFLHTRWCRTSMRICMAWRMLYRPAWRDRWQTHASNV